MANGRLSDVATRQLEASCLQRMLVTEEITGNPSMTSVKGADGLVHITAEGEGAMECVANCVTRPDAFLGRMTFFRDIEDHCDVELLQYVPVKTEGFLVGVDCGFDSKDAGTVVLDSWVEDRLAPSEVQDAASEAGEVEVTHSEVRVDAENDGTQDTAEDVLQDAQGTSCMPVSDANFALSLAGFAGDPEECSNVTSTQNWMVNYVIRNIGGVCSESTDHIVEQPSVGAGLRIGMTDDSEGQVECALTIDPQEDDPLLHWKLEDCSFTAAQSFDSAFMAVIPREGNLFQIRLTTQWQDAACAGSYKGVLVYTGGNL